MQQLWEAADFVRGIRRHLRFGEFSRAPLRLLRLGLGSGPVECDWEIRSPDVWDASLRRADRERNISQQTLCDAIAMREMVFAALPTVGSALLRGFRASAAREPPELVITGCFDRETCSAPDVSSLVMRAKLLGFHFALNDEVLQPLQSQEYPASEVLSGFNFHNMTL